MLSIDYCWVRGGVGGQLHRYWYWSAMFNDLLSRKYKLLPINTNSSFRSQQTCKRNNWFLGIFFSFCWFATQTYESSMNWVNICKFVASFPGIFAVSRIPDLLQKFREKGATYMLVFMFLFLFPFLICVLQCTLESLCSPGSHPITT